MTPIRGVISGLTLKHGRGHLFRAALEGIAFGTELILETMRKMVLQQKPLSWQEGPQDQICGCKFMPMCPICL